MKYYELLKQMPAGLDRAILRILSFHEGRENAIGRGELVYECKRIGFRVNERQIREAIKQLRRQGHLICSAAGEDGGYYMARNWAEFEEFAKQEYIAKIADMQETLAAMKNAARQQFGEAIQERLF